MRVPLVSDPEVWEQLYERFPYLAGQPLTLRGTDCDDLVIGTLEAGELLAFVTADDQPLPYPPDFPFLTRGENRALARYVQVQVLEPWPQPLIDVAWEGQGAEVVSRVERVKVRLKPVGSGQLWYGGRSGVLWEALLTPSTGARSGHGTLLHRLCELCETYLAAKGVRSVHTYDRDPAFEATAYAAFLHRRGYTHDLARAYLPGGRVAVVKDLTDFGNNR